MKRLVAYDLDGTLAASKQPIESATAALLARLTKLVVLAAGAAIAVARVAPLPDVSMSCCGYPANSPFDFIQDASYSDVMILSAYD